MAAKPKMPHGFKDRMTAKLGPLPVYGWAVLAVVGYFLYSHFAGAGASSATTPSSTATTGTAGTGTDSSGSSGGGASGSQGSSGGDSTGTYDLLAQLLNGQTALANDFAAFSIPTSTQSPTGDTAVATSNGAAGADSSMVTYAAPSSTITPASTAAAIAQGTGGAVGVYKTGGGTILVGQDAKGAAVGAKQGTGATKVNEIASVKKLKNGATLTTYQNGRQVEQAPGHTPYVVKK